MNRLFHSYLNSYRGLSRPTWMLATVIFINRTGAMVLPFLGIYMTTVLGFDLKQAGFVLSCFGMGAVVGSISGGWLTDRLGHFKVQTTSLFLAVPVFLLLPYLHTVESLAAGVFTLSCITEIFRPANSVSISHYAKPENITRAFSLNRMALNLGFSIGPALGGFFAAISYHLLFYGNAISSTLAGVVFYFYFHKKEKKRITTETQIQKKSTGIRGRTPWLDVDFLIFSLLCFVFSMCFFQLMNTLPLYYKEVYQLKDWDIGFLLASNGIIVFALEMIIVSLMERLLTTRRILVIGMLLCSLSFITLLPVHHLSILYLSMFFLSLSEIFAMPFMATVAIQCASSGREGAYMGINSLSFSAAFIFSPIAGTAIASRYGYNTLWEITALVALVTAIGFGWIMKRIERRRKGIGEESESVEEPLIQATRL